MGSFDFLDNIGEQKGDFNTSKSVKADKERMQYLEILVSRNLMMEQFKEEVIQLYNTTKSIEIFNNNVQKSINLIGRIEVKIIGIDENMFKLKNDEFEYIGAIDRMPNDGYVLSANRGKVSYTFAMQLFHHLKNRVLLVNEINGLSDALDFRVLSVLEVEQLTKDNS